MQKKHPLKTHGPPPKNRASTHILSLFPPGYFDEEENIDLDLALKAVIQESKKNYTYIPRRRSSQKPPPSEDKK